MISLAAGVLLGTLLFQQLVAIPAPHWLGLSVPAVLLLGQATRRIRRLRLPAALLFGFAWAHGYALLTEPPLLPEAFLGEPVRVVGRVAGLVERNALRQRMIVELETLWRDGQTLHGRWRVRLSWYDAEFEPQPGQRLELEIKLRPARNFSNPGSFDYEGSLYRRGIRYTGYVRELFGTGEGHDGFALTALRQRVSDRIAAALPGAPAAGVLRALVVGDRAGISQAQWQTFRRTGTNHLVAISGLHVGLVAGAVGGLVTLLWRRVPGLIARWPARQAGLIAGLTAAVAYAALAGFSLPTQRAVIMLAVAALALLARRRQRWPDLYASAVIAVLLLEPTAVLAPGFWLSFGAVGAILLVARRPPDEARGAAMARVGAAVRIQLAIGLALAPALLALGLGVPWLQTLVNLVAVPVFSFLVVPPALVGGLAVGLWPEPGATLLVPIGALTDGVLSMLARFDPGGGAVFTPARPGPAAILLGLGGVALLLLPRGWPGRHLAPLLVVPLLVAPPREAGPAHGDYRLHVLDVGQGLASVVETAGHVLVFDAGPRFRSGFNTGASVVAPFVRELGRTKIDLAVLSHADIDHAGGASGLLEAYPDTPVLAGEPRDGERPCRAGQHWLWDGVRFEVLHPPADHDLEGNDASCVIRVENAAGATLLTGDIEVGMERRLQRRHPSALPAALVVAPHHGSATSSSAGFVSATAPEHVVFAAGYRNRYGFPDARVVERWRGSGARLWNTAESGQLSFSAEVGAALRPTLEYRREALRYWHSRQ